MELAIDTEKRFNQLEKIIEKGMAHFVEVGTALMIIRNEKLYKDTFRNFEEYCQERWGFQRNYANKLIASAKVSENLGTTVPLKPTSESQTRPLTHLEPEQQKEVWKKAVETAPKGRVTARHVEQVINGLEMARPEENIVDGEKEEQDEIIEDSVVLKQLKKYWAMADSFDKELFIKWVKEEK